MKRIIYLFALLLFFGCSDSDSSSDVKIITHGEEQYKMPVISTNVAEIEKSLSSIAADHYTMNRGNKVLIQANLTKEESKLFKSFTYEIEKENDEVTGFSLSYKFHNAESVDKELLDSIIEYFDKNATTN